MHVAIMGAGIIGMTSAYYLCKKGYNVTLVDAASDIASGSSFANAGQLSWSYTDPFADPDLLSKIPGMVLGRDEAFRVKFPWSLGLMCWGAKMLTQCTGEKARRNMRALLELTLQSRQAFEELVASESLDFGHDRCGKLMLLSDDKAMKKAAERSAIKREAGCNVTVVGRSEAIRLEPSLENYGGQFAGAIYAPDDSVGDARKFARSLNDTLVRTGRLETLTGTRINRLIQSGRKVEALDTTAGLVEADAYVNALGPGAAGLMTSIGQRVPVYPLKGYSITMPGRNGINRVSITDLSRKLVFSRMGKHLRVAGFSDMVGNNLDVPEGRIGSLTRTAQELMPDAGDYNNIELKWAGLRPATPNGLPIVGGTKLENLYMNIGHGMLGWTLACGSAKRLADCLPER